MQTTCPLPVETADGVDEEEDEGTSLDEEDPAEEPAEDCWEEEDELPGRDVVLLLSLARWHPPAVTKSRQTSGSTRVRFKLYRIW